MKELPEIDFDEQKDRKPAEIMADQENYIASLEKELALGRLIRIFLCIEVVFLCGIILGMLAGKEEIWIKQN